MGDFDKFIRDLKQETDFVKYVLLIKEHCRRLTVLISVKDTACKKNVNDARCDALKHLGMQTSFSKYRQPFIGIVKAGVSIKEIQEESHRAIFYTLDDNGIKYELSSAAYGAGNFSEIIINGTNYSANERGFNFVVYDNVSRRAIDSVAFDAWDGFKCIRECKSQIAPPPPFFLASNSKCTGCSACSAACPLNCITMESTTEGFLFPKIDYSECIGCRKCQSTCPIGTDANSIISCYAVMASDEIRQTSSSGGVFALACDFIFSKGGVVCGAVFSDDYGNVEHIIGKQAEAFRMRQSKYIQSNLSKETLRSIRKLLENKTAVLFTGCPCQVAGLNSFLRKDYDNLFTIDLICHGVPSKLAWTSFLKERKLNLSSMDNIHFRNKLNGWSPALRLWSTDIDLMGKKHDLSFEANQAFCSAFLGNYCLRESCYNCQWCSTQRPGDITIGDFWGIDKHNPNYNDKKGTSVVLQNTEKGGVLLEFVKSRSKLFVQTPVKAAVDGNKHLRSPAARPAGRNEFYKRLTSFGFSKTARIAKDAQVIVDDIRDLKQRSISHKKEYDVGLLGWHYNGNFGGAWNYFALHQTLVGLGKKVLTIQLPNGNHYADKEEMPRAFLEQYYTVSQKRTAMQMREIDHLVDTYATASDQLFREKDALKFSLGFAGDNIKKIAISTSFGEHRLSCDKSIALEFTKNLQRYDYLSIREASGVETCKSIYNLKADLISEPVFWLDKSVYLDLAKMKKRQKCDDNICFSYMLSPSQENVNFFKYVSKQLKLTPYLLLGRETLQKHNAERVSKIDFSGVNIIDSPDFTDLVYYTNKANFTFTTSFHGTCFSLLFNKPFIAIQGGVKTRYHTLLGALDLLNRYIRIPEKYENCKSLLIDDLNYSRINSYIDIETAKAKTWIKFALDAPKRI